ncbi:prolyl oligopeptidase family serine peptidase [Polaromonas sp.]|uniref:alpha/beta hydrolase family protein n=1 Tax=Polaromonas sp. TaxID=1869339 RepID=UPI0032639EC5
MSFSRIPAAVSAALVLLALAACTTAPTHSNLAAAQGSGELAPLVPVRRFVANIDFAAGFVLSPDGQRLMWRQTVATDGGLAVRQLAEGSPVTTYAVGNQGRGGGTLTWMADSRHVLYSKDLTGDENTQLFVQDAQSSVLAPWDVTPWRGVRSVYLGRSGFSGAKFFFASNRRDKSTLDLYEGDAQTRSFREMARSDGTVTSWILGLNRELVGRARQLGRADGSDVAIELLRPDGSWRTLKTVGGFDSYWMYRVDTAAGKAWVTSNIGRDKSALLEVDLASGQERVVAAHDQVDLSTAFFGTTGGPMAYVFEPDMPRISYLDAAMERDVQAAVQKALAAGLLPAEPVITRPQGFSEDQQLVVLRSVGHFDSAELLLDRRTGQVKRLNPLQREAASVLAKEEPFSFKASDGRVIHGYLIRPRGVKGPVPMVVSIHGGPWVRESWSPAVFDSPQLLANRGYAVMTLNYRGSAGYGREHMWAGEREYFGRLQKDIAEGVQWAIDQKVADPKRLAVMGASFGGFSVLAQLIQKPHDYACGVDVVGVANWPRLADSWPAFWRSRHMFARFYGDVNKPEDRAQMLANSPITHLDKITAPLLVVHGGNDIRVLRQDSDDVLAGLKKLGRPVEYLLFTDEGHSISKWRNRLAMWRTIEDKLAGCLGGRSAGFDYYQLMPR